MARRRRGVTKNNNSPTHILKIGTITEAKTGGWTRVGVAWLRDGMMSIRLNKGVVLDWHDFYSSPADTDFTLMLFPNDE